MEVDDTPFPSSSKLLFQNPMFHFHLSEPEYVQFLGESHANSFLPSTQRAWTTSLQGQALRFHVRDKESAEVLRPAGETSGCRSVGGWVGG